LLQFSTHGFFAPTEAKTPSSINVEEDEDNDALLHSALILAGYNHRSDIDQTFYFVGNELLSTEKVKARGLKEDELEKQKIEVGDGILTAYEVTGIDLQGTRLVNLTACDTGVGTITADGVTGLREAFLLAGARALTMSLWAVPVRQTMQQIGAFYDFWLGKGNQKGMTGRPYAAFHASQLAALKQARSITNGSGHPFYWAGTIYLGDPGDLPTAPANSSGK
jgi:CHAT domain-containing protein